MFPMRGALLLKQLSFLSNLGYGLLTPSIKNLRRIYQFDSVNKSDCLRIIACLLFVGTILASDRED
jgi:hypothetical protein